MPGLDSLGLKIFSIAGLLSLLLLTLKTLGREFETVAIVWIRAD